LSGHSEERFVFCAMAAVNRYKDWDHHPPIAHGPQAEGMGQYCEWEHATACDWICF
jgi:hypothetical protein